MSFGTDEASLLVKGRHLQLQRRINGDTAGWRTHIFWRCAYREKLVRKFVQQVHANRKRCSGKFPSPILFAFVAIIGEGIVRRHRNFILRKGLNLVSFLADNEFETEELEELAAQTLTSDTNLSQPYSHAKVAEADIKAWRLQVRQVMKTARSDPKSKGQVKHWPCASECITDHENMLYSEQSPAQTPWESMTREQPDWSVAQVPMCRIWFFVYPNLRQSAPFADRRAEGIFAGATRF